MPINAGRDASLQIGLESAWGTAVAPTIELPFTSENLRSVNTWLTEDALVGGKTTGRMDLEAFKTEGDFNTLLKPDVTGLLIAAALGAEGAPTAVNAGSTVYDHQFSMIPGGSASSLPKLTIVVDRKVAVFGYVSSKIDTMTIEAAVNDYVRGTFGVRGHSEAADALESLSSSTTVPFKFRHGSVTVGGSARVDISRVSINVTNDLENDLFTMDGSAYMREIEPQNRIITVDMDTVYTTAMNAIRSTNFMGGASLSAVFTFTSTEVIDTGYYYTLTFTLPLCYVTDAQAPVAGPGRITQSISMQATEDDSNEAITITLRDGSGSSYLS